MLKLNNVEIVGKVVNFSEIKNVFLKDSYYQTATVEIALKNNKTNHIMDVHLWGNKTTNILNSINLGDYVYVSGKLTTKPFKEFKNITIYAKNIQIIGKTHLNNHFGNEETNESMDFLKDSEIEELL